MVKGIETDSGMGVARGWWGREGTGLVCLTGRLSDWEDGEW